MSRDRDVLTGLLAELKTLHKALYHYRVDGPYCEECSWPYRHKTPWPCGTVQVITRYEQMIKETDGYNNLRSP